MRRTVCNLGQWQPISLKLFPLLSIWSLMDPKPIISWFFWRFKSFEDVKGSSDLLIAFWLENLFAFSEVITRKLNFNLFELSDFMESRRERSIVHYLCNVLSETRLQFAIPSKFTTLIWPLNFFILLKLFPCLISLCRLCVVPLELRCGSLKIETRIQMFQKLQNSWRCP